MISLNMDLGGGVETSADQGCNCSTMVKGCEILCGKPAAWRHPYYPDGRFCQEHKELVAVFRPQEWERIETR